MRNKKMALIVVGVLVLLLLGGFLGWAVASNQEQKPYPFLSDLYNTEEYTPTYADWKELRFTAYYNCEKYLTDKLIQASCNAILSQIDLSVWVDTKIQPTWDVYLGDGRFSVSDRELRAAYIEATDAVLENIRIYFPEEESELSEQEITIEFAIHGSPVGSWRGGSFKLAGEE